MESLIIVMICLPFVSALLLALFKNNTARQIITYASCAGIIGLAVTFPQAALSLASLLKQKQLTML